MASKAVALFLAGILVVLGLGMANACEPNCHCPRDALQLGACADVLNLVPLKVGDPPVMPCCSLVAGLADLEAAVCLCTIININGNVTGFSLRVPINLSILLNNCGRNTPHGFECPLN